MKDLHEDCGVLNPEQPCKTYRRSVNHDDKCVFCGHDYQEHFQAHGRALRVIVGPIRKGMKIRPRNVEKKTGRNEKCPCQSGLKFKNCCGK